MKKSRSYFFAFPLAFVGDLGFSLLQVLNVLYGVILGATPFETGLIGAGYGATYVVSAAIFGRMGDKLPRKYSLTIATLCQVLISLYYLLMASTVVHLILGQILIGCVYGLFWPSIEAYISEYSSTIKNKHQKTISNFCLAWSIGFMLGPLLAGFFSELDLKIAFLLILVFYFIGFCLVVFFIKSKDIIKTNKNLVQEPIDDPSGEKTKKKFVLVKIMLGMLVYAMLARVILVYYADYSKRTDGLGLFGPIVGVMLFAYGLGRTGYFVASRAIKSKFNRINYSYPCVALLLFSLIFTGNIYQIIIILLLLGIFSGLIYKSALDLLLYREKKAKGAMAGLFESAIGLGGSLTPLMAGLLAEVSLIFPFFIFSIICISIFVINLIIDLKS